MTAARQPSGDRGILLAAQSLAIDTEIARITRTFEAAGIDNILLKGPAIAKWLYRDGSPRPYVDGDLLVAPTDTTRAEEILRQRGYAHQPLDDLPGDRPWHAHFWASGLHGIDLHRTLIGVRTTPDELWRILSKRTEMMQVGGIQLRVLDIPARLMHIALHAAQNGPTQGKSMEDLDRALRLVDLEEWREASELAASLEALPSFVAGLRLMPEGVEITEVLNIEAHPTTEVVLRASGHPRLSLGFEWFFRSPGIWAKTRFLRSKLFPPPDFMRAWSPIAARGPLGLVLSYPWRIGWLVAHAPRGFVSWFRARRSG